MNHQDIVERIHAAEPASTWQSSDAMLGFVLRVIAALPASEKTGLVKAPSGGENVAHYGPLDVWVRVNRVATPNGQLWKILEDSGVGGANKPAWNDNGIEPDLYVALGDAPIPEPVPVPAPAPAPPVDLAPVVAALVELKGTVIALGHEIDQLKDQIEELTEKPDPVVTVPPVTFPVYGGSIFGMRVKLTPEGK